MRSARTAVFATAGLMLIVGGCATSPSAYRNRDEPINRTTSTDPPYQSYQGTVVGVDPAQRVIVLDDGRTYRVVGEQAVTVNGQPVVLERVQPGTPVTIVSGTPVIYQNGQYVAVAPGATTAVAVPSTSMARVYGRVTDVEANGNVKVRLPDGHAFEFRPPVGHGRAPGRSRRDRHDLRRSRAFRAPPLASRVGDPWRPASRVAGARRGRWGDRVPCGSARDGRGARRAGRSLSYAGPDTIEANGTAGDPVAPRPRRAPATRRLVEHSFLRALARIRWALGRRRGRAAGSASART